MKKTTHKSKKVISASLGLVTLMLVGSAFTAPLNIGKSESTINKGVITKKVAKKQSQKLGLNSDHKKSVKAKTSNTVQKQSNTATSNNPGSYLSKLSSINPTKIKSAANDQQQAAQLIQSETGITQDQAQKAAQELFSDSQYTDLRNDLSNGNWLAAYGQYQQLSNNGALKKLQQSLN